MVGVLTHLTFRSPSMMSELRKLFLLTDEHDISIKTKCISGRERLGRPTQPRDRQLRLAACHPRLPVLRQVMGTPLSQPFRLLREQAAPALQRQVEGWKDRGSGLHSPRRSGLLAGNQLMQPTLVPIGRPQNKAATIRCGGHSHRIRVRSIMYVEACDLGSE